MWLLLFSVYMLCLLLCRVLYDSFCVSVVVFDFSLLASLAFCVLCASLLFRSVDSLLWRVSLLGVLCCVRCLIVLRCVRFA